MIGLEGKTLRSQRMTYRLLEEGDKPALAALLRDREVTEPAGFLPPESPADFDRFFTELTLYQTGVAILAEDVLIGYFHVNPYRTDQEPYAGQACVDVGFVVGKAFQGQGYGTEAVGALTAYLKDRFAWCFAAHFTENAASRRALEKCGYTLLGAERVIIPALGEEKECLRWVR